MNGGIVVLCRYSSSRLPGKILKEIDGQAILYHIYWRLRQQFPASQILIATSDHPSDQKIEDFCQQHDISCFRGSLENVAQRFLQAAQSQNWDYVVRINGDNLFIDLNTLQEMLDVFQKEEYDFVSNVPGRTFPYGMSIEMVKTSFFKKVLAQIEDEHYLEHVTLYLYEHEELGNRLYIKNEKYTTLQGAKFAVDEQKDYDFAVDLMKKLGDNKYTYTLETLEALLNESRA